jgi:PKD repeat protein
MIAAAGEASYTADSPFHDAPLCLPDGCYYLSIDSNEPFALGTNINVFLTLNGSNVLESAEIITQEEFNITYFFGINSSCSGQPECYASFEPVYTNTPGHVEFINTSTYTGAATFLWDYGNGTMGDSFGGNVQYETNGIYAVCLTINTENCQNTYCNFVNIDNMEVPCIYNEVSVIVDAEYLEPINELLEVVVSFGLEPIYSISLETNGIINDTLNFCVPDGCYSISVESGLPVQAQTIACSIEGLNIQQLGDLQLNLGETSSTAAIGVNMDCSIGLDELHSTEVNAFPNPASDVIQFTSTETISRIEIYNLTGTRIAFYNPNQTGVLIHTDEWSSGLYIARIMRGKEFVSLPIEILH